MHDPTQPLKNEIHEAFCHQYLVDLNATKAYERVRPGQKGTRQSASRLLSRADIQARIAHLNSERHERVDLSADRVLVELHRIAMLDPLDLFEPDGRLRPLADMPEHARRAIAALDVETRRVGDDEHAVVSKLKLHGKTTALDLLGRHLQLFQNEGANRDVVINVYTGVPDPEEEPDAPA